ncbi:UNVERIFIED_CONTAM: hypothetical protein FKN15_051664 [Acipenser sinensis]
MAHLAPMVVVSLVCVCVGRYFLWQFCVLCSTLDFWSECYSWPLLVYMLLICLYPFTSSCAHTFSSMSAEARHVCYFFDYGALSLYSLGCAITYGAYVMPDRWINSVFHHCFIPVAVLNTLVCTALSCYSRCWCVQGKAVLTMKQVYGMVQDRSMAWCRTGLWHGAGQVYGMVQDRSMAWCRTGLWHGAGQVYGMVQDRSMAWCRTGLWHGAGQVYGMVQDRSMAWCRTGLWHGAGQVYGMVQDRSMAWCRTGLWHGAGQVYGMVQDRSMAWCRTGLWHGAGQVYGMVQDRSMAWCRTGLWHGAGQVYGMVQDRSMAWCRTGLWHGAGQVYGMVQDRSMAWCRTGLWHGAGQVYGMVQDRSMAWCRTGLWHGAGQVYGMVQDRSMAWCRTGHSHQLFHICAVVGTHFQMEAILADMSSRRGWLAAHTPMPSFLGSVGAVSIGVVLNLAIIGLFSATLLWTPSTAHSPCPCNNNNHQPERKDK